MVRIREKRSVKIPPTKIDKELLAKVGQILRTECPKDSEISIKLYADSRDIETEDVKEIPNIDIPSDAYLIEMMTGHLYKGILPNTSEVSENSIQIKIDFGRTQDSKIRIIGKNPTWVRGVTEGLLEAFKKKKLGYSFIAKHDTVRRIMSWFTSALLAASSGYTLWSLQIELPYVSVFGIIFFAVMIDILKRFFDWVFPYFEIATEDFMPRKVRKIALGILWGSGILQTILLKILGF